MESLWLLLLIFLPLYELSAPVQLLSINGEELALEEKGLQVLRNTNTKIAFIAAAGEYRSGKSFLLNKLQVAPYNESFGVGHEMDTYTRGVWMRPQVKEINGETVTIFWLDTEGMFSPEASVNYGAKLFSFAMLFSSVLICNNVQQFNDRIFKFFSEQDSTSRIIARELTAQGLNTSHFLNQPSVVWIILKALIGNPQKVLEKFLAEVPNPLREEHIKQQNSVRSNIRDHYDNKAFALPYAVTDTKLFSKLHTLAWEELDISYREQVDKVREHVFDRLASKPIRFHGRTLPEVLKAFMGVITNSKFSGDMKSVFLDTTETTMCAEFGRHIRPEGTNTQLPLSYDMLVERRKIADEEAKKIGDKLLSETHIVPPDGFYHEVKECCDREWNALLAKNERLLEDQLMENITQVAATSMSCFIRDNVHELTKKVEKTYGVLGRNVTRNNRVTQHIINTRAMRLRSCLRLSDLLWGLWPILVGVIVLGIVKVGPPATLILIVAPWLAYQWFWSDLPPYLRTDFPISDVQWISNLLLICEGKAMFFVARFFPYFLMILALIYFVKKTINIVKGWIDGLLKKDDKNKKQRKDDNDRPEALSRSLSSDPGANKLTDEDLHKVKQIFTECVKSSMPKDILGEPTFSRVTSVDYSYHTQSPRSPKAVSGGHNKLNLKLKLVTPIDGLPVPQTGLPENDKLPATLQLQPNLFVFNSPLDKPQLSPPKWKRKKPTSITNSTAHIQNNKDLNHNEAHTKPRKRRAGYQHEEDLVKSHVIVSKS